jgi:hypothetical protein
MKKLILFLLFVLLTFCLLAETMIIHLSNGDIIEFGVAQIEQITFDGDVSVEEMVQFVSRIPIQFLKNYPNPFNPTTTIMFETGKMGLVQVDIFNTKGQKVKRLVNETLPSGEHSFLWKGLDDNGRNVASGVYFYKVAVNKSEKVNKMLMIK